MPHLSFTLKTNTNKKDVMYVFNLLEHKVYVRDLLYF